MKEASHTSIEKDEPKRVNFELHPNHAGQIVDYFVARQHLPDYAGYAEIAAVLQKRLERVVEAAEERRNIIRPLPVVPSADPFKLYGDSYPEGTAALMLLTDRLTNAEPVVVERDKKTGYGHVVSHGRWDTQDIYFIETYARNEQGRYMSWAVASELPEELLPYAPSYEPGRFYTSSERLKFMEKHLVDAEQWPTIDIDESEVVKNWVSRRAA